ncbi:MAG: hypothetical protein ABI608_09335 [Rhizomicrobium sp.]
MSLKKRLSEEGGRGHFARESFRRRFDRLGRGFLCCLLCFFGGLCLFDGLCLFGWPLRGFLCRLFGFFRWLLLGLGGLGRLSLFGRFGLLLFLRCHVIHSMVSYPTQKPYAPSSRCASACLALDEISFATDRAVLMR